jgi:hypothetical protein
LTLIFGATFLLNNKNVSSYRNNGRFGAAYSHDAIDDPLALGQV